MEATVAESSEEDPRELGKPEDKRGRGLNDRPRLYSCLGENGSTPGHCWRRNTGTRAVSHSGAGVGVAALWGHRWDTGATEGSAKLGCGSGSAWLQWTCGDVKAAPCQFGPFSLSPGQRLTFVPHLLLGGVLAAEERHTPAPLTHPGSVNPGLRSRESAHGFLAAPAYVRSSEPCLHERPGALWVLEQSSGEDVSSSQATLTSGDDGPL